MLKRVAALAAASLVLSIPAMAGEAGKLRVIDPVLDWSEPYGLWAGLAGGAFVALGSHGVDQLMVQRYLSARGLPEARRALWVSGVVAVAQFALFLLIGVGLWSFYQLHPPAVDPDGNVAPPPPRSSPPTDASPIPSSPHSPG